MLGGLHKSRAQPRAAVAKQLHVVEAATAGPQSDTGPVASSHRPVGVVDGECFWVIEMIASDHPSCFKYSLTDDLREHVNRNALFFPPTGGFQ